MNEFSRIIQQHNRIRPEIIKGNFKKGEFTTLFNSPKVPDSFGMKKGELKDVPGERWITIQGNRIMIGNNSGKAGELHTKEEPASSTVPINYSNPMKEERKIGKY